LTVVVISTMAVLSLWLTEQEKAGYNSNYYYQTFNYKYKCQSLT